ncbi:MAG: heme NO-binding domain-containing protein [Flavobacteriaceae bacterium]
MKGIVFTEFLEMVEGKFGFEVADNIIEKANLPSNGVYTSVGTYDFNEMVSLVTQLSEEVNLPMGDLIYAFGLYLFDGLVRTHPEVAQNYTDPLGLIYSIEDHIHLHVRKLYPDAELPEFKVLEKTDNKLSIVYSSSRGLYRLAHGLIEKTFEHFGSTGEITYELL